MQLPDRVAWSLAFALGVFPPLAFAQSAALNGFPPGTFQSRAAIDAGGASTPFSITYNGQVVLASASCTVGGTTTCNYTISIGTPDPTRIVAVPIWIRPNGTNPVVNSVTINGVSATQAINAYKSVNSGGLVVDGWYAPVPLGSGSVTVTVVSSLAITRMGIVSYSIIGTSSAFSAANAGGTTSALTTNIPVTVPTGGGSVGVAVTDGTPTAASFTNLTQDFSGPIAGNQWPESGHDTSHSGSTTFTATWTGGSNGNVIISVMAFSP